MTYDMLNFFVIHTKLWHPGLVGIGLVIVWRRGWVSKWGRVVYGWFPKWGPLQHHPKVGKLTENPGTHFEHLGTIWAISKRADVSAGGTIHLLTLGTPGNDRTRNQGWKEDQRPIPTRPARRPTGEKWLNCIFDEIYVKKKGSWELVWDQGKFSGHCEQKKRGGTGLPGHAGLVARKNDRGGSEALANIILQQWKYFATQK